MNVIRTLVPPLLGAALALALLPWTWRLDVIGRGLGPGFWPRVALLGLALACLAKFFEEWRRRASSSEGFGSPPERGSPHTAISGGTLALGIALIVGYVWLAPRLGFALVTALFIAAFMALCGTRSWRAIAANVVVGTVGLLYLFVKLVYLPLPKGDGPFEALTLALYRALRLF
jgi:putative tricarboxylic transport membrane protein